MKAVLKSVIIPFLLAAVAAFFANDNTVVVPELLRGILTKYSESKAVAKGYPIWVFMMLFVAAASEALAVIGVTRALVNKGFDKALSKVLSVGFAFLGVIAGLTFALWLRGDAAQVSQGVGLFIIALIFVATPVGLAFSFRLLRGPHHSQNHQRVMKWVTLVLCCCICLISAFGVFMQLIS